MITSLRLQNFRCFRDHRLPLRATTVIVGRNNAGKSTVVEALRLVSLVVQRYGRLPFSDVPRWLDIPRAWRGMSPSLLDFDLNHKSLFYRYSDPPATITATFVGGASVEIYVGRAEKIHAVVKDPQAYPVTTRAAAQRVPLSKVSALPQIGPLQREEVVLGPDYVRRMVSSSLASSHFRNQLNLYPELFEDFKRAAEGSWPRLRIRGLEGRGGLPGEDSPLALLVQDGDFSAEVAWMGHGLQMWLQTMWFLARAQDDGTIILDEPDVYLHADLQRKLIRLIRKRSQQIIIATHSVEMIADVEPDEILVIDRRQPTSTFAVSLPVVQRVVDEIGGIANLQLTRLWTSQKCLLVEGDDIDILKVFHSALYPDSEEPLDHIPSLPIGGWGGWNYAIGSRLLLKNAVGQSIKVFCVLDSDYHSDDERADRYTEARDHGIVLHIWQKKEIENYLLNPDVICRVITSRTSGDRRMPESLEVRTAMEQAAEEEKESALDAIAAELWKADRQGGVTTANRKARERVGVAWSTFQGKTSLVSGKAILAKLSQWSQRQFGVSFGPMTIARAMSPGDIDAEVRKVLDAIERNAQISP